MLQRTEHLYVVTDDQILGGEPIIDGTRTPVRAIVELWRQGIAPETIPADLPHLTLARRLTRSASTATIRKRSTSTSSTTRFQTALSIRWYTAHDTAVHRVVYR